VVKARLFSFLLVVCITPAFAAPTAAELSRSLHAAGLDRAECYRVRDLNLSKEDIHFYLTDGYLIFSKPVMGERLSAVFTTDVEGGDGEVIVLPPTRGERQSLSAFTQSPNLDEHLYYALIFFTDGSAGKLLAQIHASGAEQKAPEMAALLAEKWDPVLAHLMGGIEMRIIQDLLKENRQNSGVVFFSVSGKKLGNFEISCDDRARNQIDVRQVVVRDGLPVENTWTAFPSRGFRTGTRHAPPQEFAIGRYQIDATVDADLRVRATTRATVHVGANPLRVLPFGITSAMQVTSVKVDGAPAELFFRSGSTNQSSEDAPFLVVTPGLLASQTDHEFEFEHEGAVIRDAGDGVYFVAARATWYPHFASDFSTYDLTFRYPKKLTLVTPGDVVEDRLDGDWRVTRRRTAVAIRVAGFNLGEYQKVGASVAGINLEVYGNRHLENALQPRTVIIPDLPAPRERRQRMPTPPTSVLPERMAPDPLGRLRAVATDVSSSLQFFKELFGEPALNTLTVSPIPGTFGQGFPGLVYLSTLAYLDPLERPAAVRSAREEVFFSDLIAAHETAHQWWGNVVTVDNRQDEWLLESLANYSALLWLERKKGTKALDSVLDDYRDQLTARNVQGHVIDSVGPIVWGPRLDAGDPGSWRVITYGKGAWIIHMMRRRLGNERFLKMLAELRRRYEFRSVTIDDFEALAKEFLPPKVYPESIDAIFDNWVYSTGIPTLKVKYQVKGVAPAVKLTGTLDQSDVDDDFSVDVPVQIQFAKGPSQTVWVRTSSEPEPFAVMLRQAPLRVSVGDGVLAKK